MMEKMLKYIKEAIFFIFMLVLFANALSYYRSSSLNKSKLELPSTLTLLNSTEYLLPNNKPLLLYFWASWCPTCKIQSTNIEALSKRYHVLTIALKSGNDININEYLKEHNLSFNVINDYSGTLTKSFGISIFPTAIIYDKNKNEVFSDVGYTTNIGLELRMWWASLQ